MAVKIQSFEKYEVEQSCRRIADSFGWDVSFLCDTVQFAVGELASSPNGWDLAICSFESLMADLIEGRFRSVVEWLKLGKPAGSSFESPYISPKEATRMFKIDDWTSGAGCVVSADIPFEYDGLARITIDMLKETTVVSIVRPAKQVLKIW